MVQAKKKKSKPSEAPKKGSAKAATKTDKRSEHEDDEIPATLGGNSQAVLKGYVERIERLMEEKAGVAEEIKDLYTEAHANSFDRKILRKVIALRKMNAEKRREEQQLVELYCAALGLA